MTHRCPLGLFAALAMLLVMALSGPDVAAAADRWSDITDAEWLRAYGVDASRVATVASGYEDNTFLPYAPVSRAQVAKMAVNGLGLALVYPSSPSFEDVPESHPLHRYVESACAAGIVSGYVDGSFRPDDAVTRQQVNSILGRFLSESELRHMSVIWGVQRSYPSLESWYRGEADFWLGVFSDLDQLATVHRPTTGYLVYHDVVNGGQQGSQFYLSPQATLSRAQAVVMVLRTCDALADVAPGFPPAPTDLMTFPEGPSSESAPWISGKTIPGGLVTVYANDGSEPVPVASVYAEDTTGGFSVRVPLEKPLAEGRHVLTARVRNKRMLWSEPSVGVDYVVDASPPYVNVSVPENGSVLADSAPYIRASAGDVLSAVMEVAFRYAQDEPGAAFHSISVDGVAPFRAEWGALSLPDGVYVLQAVARDGAGNTAVSEDVRITIDLEAPHVEIIQPEDPGAPEVAVSADPSPELSAIAYDLPSRISSFTGRIARVDFYYMSLVDPGAPPTLDDLVLLSSDHDSSDGQTYEAEWGSTSLPAGAYVLAAQSVDEAGNFSVLALREVVVDTPGS